MDLLFTNTNKKPVILAASRGYNTLFLTLYIPQNYSWAHLRATSQGNTIYESTLQGNTFQFLKKSSEPSTYKILA